MWWICVQKSEGTWLAVADRRGKIHPVSLVRYRCSGSEWIKYILRVSSDLLLDQAEAYVPEPVGRIGFLVHDECYQSLYDTWILGYLSIDLSSFCHRTSHSGSVPVLVRREETPATLGSVDELLA
jgi:hypothetical protein